MVPESSVFGGMNSADGHEHLVGRRGESQTLEKTKICILVLPQASSVIRARAHLLQSCFLIYKMEIMTVFVVGINVNHPFVFIYSSVCLFNKQIFFTKQAEFITGTTCFPICGWV